MSNHTFISHSRDDREIVSRIIGQLKAADVAVWHDAAIGSGESWKKVIFKAITDCDCMVVCLSKSYMNSAMCRMEIFLAQCYNKKILPVMIKEECWNELHDYMELSSISDLSVINLVRNRIFGLQVTEESQIGKLISSIKNENDQRFTNSELFISYRSRDAVYASKLAEDLYQHGVNTWIATLAYKSGENWQKSQIEALMEVKGLIVVLSKEVAESEYIRREILVAITRGIFIYPVLADDPRIGTPEFLREINEELDNTRSFEMRAINEIQWFYPNKPDYESMISSIVNRIKKDKSK